MITPVRTYPNAMKNWGCIITSTVSIIRDWEGILRRSNRAERGMDRYYYPLNPITDSDLLGLITCGTDRDDPGKLLR